MRIFLLTCCFLITPLVAQSADDDCAGTTAETTACLYARYKTEDASLNAIYQRALKSAAEHSPKDLANLRDAQRKWVAYRDAACEAEYSLWGLGTGGPSAREACLLRVTRSRIEDLKSAYFLSEKPQ